MGNNVGNSISRTATNGYGWLCSFTASATAALQQQQQQQQQQTEQVSTIADCNVIFALQLASLECAWKRSCCFFTAALSIDFLNSSPRISKVNLHLHD